MALGSPSFQESSHVPTMLRFQHSLRALSRLRLHPIPPSSTPSLATRTTFSTFAPLRFAETLPGKAGFTADKFPHIKRNQSFKKVPSNSRSMPP